MERLPQQSAPSGGSSWTISRCACGQFALRLGQVQLEFSPRELARLNCLIGEAMVEFGVEPSQETVGRRRRTTH